MNHRQKELDRLIAMVRSKAWRDYALDKAEKMDADQSGLFTGIAAELKAHMQKLNLERQKNGGLDDKIRPQN